MCEIRREPLVLYGCFMVLLSLPPHLLLSLDSELRVLLLLCTHEVFRQLDGDVPADSQRACAVCVCVCVCVHVCMCVYVCVCVLHA
jgi:hypothetical protein